MFISRELDTNNPKVIYNLGQVTFINFSFGNEYEIYFYGQGQQLLYVFDYPDKESFEAAGKAINELLEVKTRRI